MAASCPCLRAQARAPLSQGMGRRGRAAAKRTRDEAWREQLSHSSAERRDELKAQRAAGPRSCHQQQFCHSPQNVDSTGDVARSVPALAIC